MHRTELPVGDATETVRLAIADLVAVGDDSVEAVVVMSAVDPSSTRRSSVFAALPV